MPMHMTPLSWIRSVRNIPDGYRQFVFAAIPEGFDPYQFGAKPVSGAKDDLKNRDCNHLQLHGEGILNDISEDISEVVFKTTVANYAYNDEWFPKGFLLPCYSYGRLTTLQVALVITDGYTQRSWAYVRSKQPGAVYPGLHEVYRTVYGKVNDTFFKVDVQLTPYRDQLMLKVDASLGFCQRNKNYRPNPDSPSSGSSEFLWGGGQLGSMDFSCPDIIGTVELPAIRTTTSLSKRLYLNPTLPDGVTLDNYSKDDPTITERIADSFMTQLKLLIKGTLSHYGSAYSRGYDTISSRSGDDSVKLASSKLVQFKRDLWAALKRSKPDFPYSVLRGEATQSAAEAAKYFAGNGIAYIQDLRRLKSTIFDLIGLLKGKKDLSAVANLWLSGRYGLKLTIQDTIDLIRGIKHAIEDDGKVVSTCRGVSRNDDVECHAKLYYIRPKPDNIRSLDDVLSMLVQWDLYPTLENLWDLIPYSFVVDWFLGIGDILDGIDSIAYTDHMDIIGTCFTVKSNWVPAHLLSSVGVAGNVSATEFIRSNPKEPYPYIPSFSGSLPSTKNFVDGAALIIQRL